MLFRKKYPLPTIFERGYSIPGAFNRDRTGDLILTMDALYLLSYEGILMPKKYTINLIYQTRVRRKLTMNVIRHVPTATVRRLLPFHARNNATMNPAAAAMTDPVENRIAGKVMAESTE